MMLSTRTSDIDLKVITPVNGKEGQQCPFSEFGCDYSGDINSLRDHIREIPTKHLSMLCDGFRDLCGTYRETQLKFESEDRQLDFLEFRFRELETIFSCQFVWRIDDVRNLLKEARDGVKTSIFSPPFYTGKQGYKLAASIALNGDGDAKGQYASIFITILRGEYDSLLSWPFAHPITFTLLDQRPTVTDRCHIIKNLNPNTCKENRSFLGRPLGDRNPRFGIKKFIKLDDLFNGDHFRDEAVFIKIDIEQKHVTKI